MQERILQVAHGDHESSQKRKRTYPSKPTVFQIGKNFECRLATTEVNALPKSRNVGDEVQIDFAGLFFDEKGKKSS